MVRRAAILLLLVIPGLLQSCAPDPFYRSHWSSHELPPMYSKGFYQVGWASYYGREFHGEPTASGECFDMFGFTAAHTTLPLGARIKVTNLENGLSVIVRVNDRGPFVEGCILDLSYKAALEIGMDRPGTAMVRIEIVGYVP